MVIRDWDLHNAKKLEREAEQHAKESHRLLEWAIKLRLRSQWRKKVKNLNKELKRERRNQRQLPRNPRTEA